MRGEKPRWRSRIKEVAKWSHQTHKHWKRLYDFFSLCFLYLISHNHFRLKSFTCPCDAIREFQFQPRQKKTRWKILRPHSPLSWFLLLSSVKLCHLSLLFFWTSIPSLPFFSSSFFPSITIEFYLFFVWKKKRTSILQHLRQRSGWNE